MNKITKNILITAGILLCVGGILMFVGSIFGGVFNGNINIGQIGAIRYTDSDCTKETIALEDFSDLTVETSFVDIDFVSGDKFELEIYAPQDCYPTIESKGKMLIIKQPKNPENISMSFNKEAPYFKITAPEDVDYAINLGSTSGDITITDHKISGNADSTSGDTYISNITASSLKQNSTSGNLTLADSTVNELTLSHTSGDENLRNVTCNSITSGGTSANLELSNVTTNILSHNTTSGDVEGEGISVSDVNITGTSSDVELVISGATEDYNYDIHTTSGDIEVGTMHTEGSYTSDSGKDKKIYVNTTSGDVELSFR